MNRYHLFEFEDQTWFPGFLRDGMTDYLQAMLHWTRPYAAIAPRLADALVRTGATRVIDLCSGGGGPWLRMAEDLEARSRGAPGVLLTDRYPNLAAFRRVAHASGGRIDLHADPVDATNLPADLQGFRTLFSSFHHFPPELAVGILRDACRKRQPIGIFEATRRHPAMILSMALVPLVVLCVTPFIRPFRWSRLFWTYVIPLIPLAAGWDGLVSCLRTYTPAELDRMVDEVKDLDYSWQSGEEVVPGTPGVVTYLIGVPVSRACPVKRVNPDSDPSL